MIWLHSQNFSSKTAFAHIVFTYSLTYYINFNAFVNFTDA